MHLARILALAAFVAAFTVPRLSRAQDAGSSTGLITIGPTVSRFLPDGKTPVVPRDGAQNPGDINYADCASNLILQFSLSEIRLHDEPS